MKALADIAQTLLDRANAADYFNPRTPATDEIRAIVADARQWISDTETQLDNVTPGTALHIIGWYDIIHRIAYAKAANRQTINRYVMSAFEAKIHGDSTVDEYDLFRAIADGIERRDPAYLVRPLHWYTLTLERWLDQFRYGTNLHLLSDYDINQRITLLQSTDLLAFEGANQSAFKHQLAEWGNSIQI